MYIPISIHVYTLSVRRPSILPATLHPTADAARKGLGWITGGLVKGGVNQRWPVGYQLWLFSIAMKVIHLRMVYPHVPI